MSVESADVTGADRSGDAPPEKPHFTARRLARASLGQGLATIWSALLGFFTAPFMIRHLGVSQYGVFALIAIISGVVSNLEFGFGHATIRFLAHARASDDAEAEQAVLSNSLLVFLPASLCAGVLVYLGAPFIVQNLAHGPSRLHYVFLNAIRISALVLVFSFLSSLIASSLQALGRFKFLIHMNLVGGTVVSLTSISIVVCGGNLVAVLIGEVITLGLGTAVQLLVLANATVARLVPRLYRAKFAEMLSYSGYTLLAGVGSELLTQIPTAVLAAYTSTAELASFSVPRTVLAQVDNLISSTSLGFLPFVSAESAGNEQRRMIAVYIANLRLTILALGLPICLLAAFAHPLLAAWISPTFATSASWPLRWCAGASLFWGLGSAPSDVARGSGRPSLVSTYTLVGATITIALAFVLTPGWHAAGTAAAICLGGAIINVPYIFFVPKRIAQLRLVTLAKRLAGPLLAFIVIAAITAGGLFVADTLVGALLTGAVGICLYLLLLFKLILDTNEKSAIVSAFSRLAS
jgi:O-antigen/teichoic acid export membrane protein